MLQKVAKDDKKSMRQSLAWLRQSNKLTKGTIDGWALIHVALAAVRELDPNSWVYSFNKACPPPARTCANTHTRTHLRGGLGLPPHTHTFHTSHAHLTFTPPPTSLPHKVNLKPSTRVSFPEWIKRIEHYVQGGESFKSEIMRDPYAAPAHSHPAHSHHTTPHHTSSL